MQVITLDHIRSAIDDSDLSRGKKRRLNRRLNRPKVVEAVLEEVTSQALAAQIITFGENNEILVDFDAIIDFIEKLLPLIIKLIGLFGRV